MGKDFWMFSWSRTGYSESSSLVFAETASGPSAALTKLNTLKCRPLAELFAGKIGSSSAAAAYTIKSEIRDFLRTLSSSIQFADSPLRALLYRGIQIRRLLKISKPLRRVRIAPFRQEIDQRYLHQRRLLLLQRVQHAFVYLGLACVPAEGIERRQPHVHASVDAQRIQQRRPHLRIEVLFLLAPAPSLQTFARGLLLQ